MKIRRLIETLLLLSCLAVLPSCAPAVLGAGAATAGVANDSRTAGALIEDQAIELKASNLLFDEFGNDLNASITSYNRIVLVTGEAPTQAMKARAEELIKGIKNVRQVSNNLAIANPSSIASEGSDAWLTLKVKRALIALQEPGFSALDVKVVSDKGVVYLLGILSKENAALAVRVARNVPGVLRVVRGFELIGE